MKNNRNFNIVLVGQILSIFGSAIQRFSFSLYLLELTGSAVIFSNVMAISTLPYILFAPIAGSVADRINKKNIMITLDVCSFLVLSLYMVFLGRGGLVVPATALVMFALAAISAFYTPAVTSVIPEIVERSELRKANSLVSQVGSIANLAGPVLAGMLYGFFGITVITIINALTFAFSAGMECFIHLEDHKEKAENEAATETNMEKSAVTAGRERISITGAFRDMLSSYQYLKSECREVLGFIKSYGLYNICVVPILTILMPYVLRTLFLVSAETYGIVEGVVAAGMIIGAFLVSHFTKRFSVQGVYKWNYLMALGIMVMAVAAAVCQKSVTVTVVFTVAGMLIMMALGIGNVVTLSYTQSRVQREQLGRVSAFSTAIATMSVPVGQVIFGIVLDMHIATAWILIFMLVVNLFVNNFVKKNVTKIKGEIL